MKAVACAIIENGKGEVLLAQRPPGKYLAGMWEFPGGKMEAGETGEQAIARELQEELELDVRIEKFLGTFPHNYPDHSIDLHTFVVRALNEPQSTAEVQCFRWIAASLISHSELAPADIVPLKRYLALRPID